MSRARWGARLLGAAVLFAASAAQAQSSFIANLTHAAEAPPGGLAPLTTSTGDPRPLSFGFGEFHLTPTGLTMDVSVFNIDVTGTQTADPNDNLVAAHIHACNAPLTPTCGVRWGFFGSPFNDTQAPSIVVTPFATGVGGTFTSVWNNTEGNGTTLLAQLTNIREGRSYINFHTVQFGAGEIRGTLVATPEPSTYALMGTGLLALVGIARRRRA